MKNIFYICMVSALVLFSCGGCLLQSMLGGAESPRPKEYQVSAVKEVVNSNVPVVVGAQTNKQDNIQIVALKALEAIKDAKTPEQAEALTNVAANSFRAIKDADGTANNLSKLMSDSNGDILNMSTLQYAAYAAGQNVLAARNQEAAYSGIRAGYQWSGTAIAKVAGGATGAGGLLAFALTVYRKMRNKDVLLKATGKAVNEYAAQNPKGGKQLKDSLAKKASELTINAKKEFGV